MRKVSGVPHESDGQEDDVPMTVIDEDDGTHSLQVTSQQAATTIQQNTTIIANQQTIITLLQGGIGVNILGGGGL
ncbi:MAG: hypothetical protein AAFM92_03195 [Pseudomonadota bacterium]